MSTTRSWELVDFAAQTASVFPQIAEPSAQLRKNRFLDRMLDRNGYRPFSLSLTDDEATSAGHELTNLLSELLGRQRMGALMEGEETLESLGVVAPIDSFIQSRLPTQILFNNARNKGKTAEIGTIHGSEISVADQDMSKSAER